MTQQGISAASFCIIRPMLEIIPSDFIPSIAPEAVEVCQDYLTFPGGILLPTVCLVQTGSL